MQKLSCGSLLAPFTDCNTENKISVITLNEIALSNNRTPWSGKYKLPDFFSQSGVNGGFDSKQLLDVSFSKVAIVHFDATHGFGGKCILKFLYI